MTGLAHDEPSPTAAEAQRFVERSEFLWHQRFELAPGVVTPGVSDVAMLATAAALPRDLAGQHVLDVGTTNGGAAIECERRGAERVVAVDVVGDEVFGITKILDFLGSDVEFVHASVYELPELLECQFDLVLFWGVLYHLRHPLLALDALRRLTAGRLSVETAVADADLGAAEPGTVRFYRRDELAGDPSNWFAPTVPTLEDWLRSSGFEPELLQTWPDGAPARALVGATPARGVPEYLQLSYEQPLRVTVAPPWSGGAPRVPAVPQPSVRPPTTLPARRPDQELHLMHVATDHFASPPARRPSVEECTFYHCMDLPEVGTQRGQWDLRPGIGSYLGDFDFAGAKVLEIGTASGFVCFEMERRGADVVAFDLDLEDHQTYDMFPGPPEDRDPEGFTAGLQATRAAYWLAHDVLGSSARVVYGHANHLPDFLDGFDAVVFGNVLQHLQDPVGALLMAASRADAVIVTESDWKRGVADDLPAMLWIDDSTPYSWYQVKPLLVESVLRSLGFEVAPTSWHDQLLLEDVAYEPGMPPEARSWDAGIEVPHYTVVARRPTLTSD
jgi:SAM-dependent methyltransferase